MKLIDIIEHLRDSQKVHKLYSNLNLPYELDEVLIYMKDELNLDSELFFFDIKTTDDLLLYSENGTQYHQFFPLEYAAEIVESYFSEFSKLIDGPELAKRLMEYRMNDA